jgi:microcystin-dependent protein
MEGTLAEIRMFAGNFAPRGWQFCNGQLLSIAQWTAVFALVGTTYGGNGQTTFGIPDFRGRIALGAQFSQGPGLPAIQLGEMAGTNNVTLLSINLPAHNHQVVGNVTPRASIELGLSDSPENAFPAGSNDKPYSATADTTMQPIPVSLPTTISGSNSPVSIMQPYIGMNYIFCVEGIFPSRN